MNSNQQTYYDLLDVHPSASAIEIRRAYRELSKKYHPDTTTLTSAKATSKFQALNEAYAVISNPERRLAYDLEIGYSRVVVLQPTSFHPISSRPDNYRSSAYLDPIDRPLSGGEIAALFMLGITFIGCLILAISIGMIRGEI
jgi:curved DNA-binding protein CbpA